MGSLLNSTKHIKKEIVPIIYSFFQKTEAEGVLFNSFYEFNINLKPKPKTL